MKTANCKSQTTYGNEYFINGWGPPYFGVSEEGDITVNVKPDMPPCNIYNLVQSLVKRGIQAPMLLRFSDILRDRIQWIQRSFDAAISEHNYQNTYRLAFPIKVNQQNAVVQAIEMEGRSHHLCLEVGSKPELVAVLANNEEKNALLLCNGYKDADYIEMALLARQIGRRSMITIEQYYELELVMEIAKRLNIEAEIGFRMKPHSKGCGKWSSSGGDTAKFGLTSPQIILGIELLKKAGKLDWVRLLHYHLGSQIPSLDAIKNTVKEAARVYTEVAKECKNLTFFDLGGGLGIDYDGTHTNLDSSISYTIEEYAREVVSTIAKECDKAKVSHPTIITESGRAITAHHAILITEVIETASAQDPNGAIAPPESSNPLLKELYGLHQELTLKPLEDILTKLKSLQELLFKAFIDGEISLKEKAYAEYAYKLLLAKDHALNTSNTGLNVDPELLDIYFCNFSLFQSLPDQWAIHQLFPISPIHRLNEKPTRRAILADISCDSDGVIDEFTNKEGLKNHLKLHTKNEEPYYIGTFLVGAYQEILGGFHNLFGDTNVAQVELGKDGKWHVTHHVAGDTIAEILRYVQYNTEELIEKLEIAIDDSLQNNALSESNAARLLTKYKEVLDHYTYLVV